jgi:hypothetical protein
MTMLQLLQAQLMDPFRIVMLVALVMVWDRNRGAEGGVLPLLAGYVFVAVLIPFTLGTPGQQVPGILAGLVSNLILLAVILALWALWQRLRRR